MKTGERHTEETRMKISAAERTRSAPTGCIKCGKKRWRHAYYPDYIDYDGKSRGRYLCKVCVQFWTFDKFGNVIAVPLAKEETT